MQLPQISAGFLISLGIATAFEILFPLALALYVSRRLHVRWRYFWYGVAVFAAVQLFTRVPLVYVLNNVLASQLKSSQAFLWTWLFILALTAYSWFINWEYARQFQSTMLANVQGVELNFLFFTRQVRDINPILASMVQVLALAYTWISDKIAANEKELTAAQLKAKADELEAVQKEKTRIKAITKGKTKEATLGVIDSGFDVFHHLKKKLAKEQEDDQQHVTPLAEQASSTEHKAGPDEAINTGSISLEQDGSSVDQSPTDKAEDRPEHAQPTQAYFGSIGRSTVSIEEAAKLLQLSINSTKRLRKEGTLKTASRNQERITIASIKAYDEKRARRHQKDNVVPINDEIKIINQ